VPEVRVLGPVEVVDDNGLQLPIGGPQPRRLIAALALLESSMVAVDRLVDAVWPDGASQPEDPRNSLQAYVSRLRRAGLPINRVGDGYALADGVRVDAREFTAQIESAAVSAGRGDPHAAVAACTDALSRWRGEIGGGLGDEEWAFAASVHLSELRLRGREDRVQWRLEAGDSGEAVADATTLASEHPLRERPCRLQMLAHQAAGDSAEALRAFQAFRSRLIEETGLEPSAELARLEQAIATGDVESDTPAATRLGSYELAELIGEGAFGAIYRATQPSVGREVAIKVVRPELANDPQFVRRFEVEAQTVARLEHPHVVPLYDFWRDPSGAYLVMRYLAGGSAEQRLMREGPWPLPDVARLVDEIGPALAIAHEAGLLHRDVKPANVLFDEAGNSYLADFGIATASGSLEAADLGSAGSPLYVSPEQVRDGEATPASDVYGFGVMLYELLTGSPPFADSDSMQALLERKTHEQVPSLAARRPDLPEAIDLLVRTATAPDAAHRFQSMAELVLAFRSATAANLPGAMTTGAAARDDSRPRAEAARTLVGLQLESINPYKGLAAFGEADESDFYGRDSLAAEIVERLAHTRLVVVTGPSGSGKSSVIRAGVLPRLRNEAALVASMVPGTHPMDEVETALLRVATEPSAALLEQLSADERGLGRAVKTLLPDDGSELVLVIDQFEELFTQTSEGRRDHFLAALNWAVADDRSRLRVICTLRADFYDRPLQHSAIGELVRVNTLAVAPLSGQELDEAISRPAASVGVTVEPALVAELVSASVGQAAGLPLLQYALTETYELRSGGRMTLEAYRSIGGIVGALANRADELYADLPMEEQFGVRRLFTRLVNPGEGTEDTRRRVLRSELGAVPGDVIDAYGAARLLAFDHDPASREPTVEVAHEALIREWPRLRGWLDEDRDGLRILRHVGQAAKAWDVSGRDAGELYRGGRLEAAEEWAAGHAEDFAPLEREFLDGSLELRAAAEAAEQRRFEDQRRVNRRLRSLLSAVAVVAAVALIAGVLAFQQRSDARDSAAEAQRQADLASRNEQLAEQQAAVAEELAALEAEQRGVAEANATEAQQARQTADVRRMVADSANQLDIDRRLSLLMAVQAHKIDPRSSTLGSIQRALVNSPTNWLGTLAGPTSSYHGVAIAGSGRLFAGGADGVDVFDLRTGEVIDSVSFDVALSAADRTGVSAVKVESAANGSLVVVTTPTGEWLMLDPGTATVEDRGRVASAVKSLAISADGAVIVLGLASQEIRVLSADRSKPDVTIPVPAAVAEVAVDASGERIAVLFGGVLPGQVWSLGEGSEPALVVDELPNDLGVATGTSAAAWHGRRLFLGGADGSLLFDVDRQMVVVEDTGLASLLLGSFYFDTTLAGDLLVTSRTGVVERLAAGGERFEVVGGVGQVGQAVDVAVDDDAGVIALAGSTGIALISTRGEGVLVAAALPLGGDAPQIEPAGRWVVSAQARGSSVEAWRLDDRGSGGEVLDPYVVTIESSGEFVLIGLSDGEWVLAKWDGERSVPIGGPLPNFPFTVELSPDRRHLVVSTLVDGAVIVYDTETGERVAELDGIDRYSSPNANPLRRMATDIKFSPDGSELILAIRNAHVVFYDTSTWRESRALGPEQGFHQLAFSHDGTFALTVHYDRGVEMRSPDVVEVLVPARSPLGSYARGTQNPEILKGDRYAVLSSDDEGFVVWDIEAWEAVGDPIDYDTAYRPPAVAGQAKLVAAATGGQTLVWNVDPDTWPELACRAAGRNMTADEWEQFGPQGEPYEATCAQWPSAAQNSIS